MYRGLNSYNCIPEGSVLCYCSQACMGLNFVEGAALNRKANLAWLLRRTRL